MSLGRSGGGVSQMDVRTGNMMQIEDAATQLLMQFLQNPQIFMKSLGMPGSELGQAPPNAFAQRANQPGITQMLYGQGASPMQLPTQTFMGGPPQQGVAPWMVPPAAGAAPGAYDQVAARANEDAAWEKFLADAPNDKLREHLRSQRPSSGPPRSARTR